MDTFPMKYLRFIKAPIVFIPSFPLEYYNEAYFRYLKSYEYLQYNDDNPFAEPANVYSNVKNGYGVFALVHAATYEVR